MTATQPEKPAPCAGLDRGHYYRKVNGVWVCMACKEPRP